MPIGKSLLAGTVLFLAVTGSQAQTFHVDRNASGPIHDGLSWCGAFTELHEALALATPGAMIKVADGLYFPDTEGLGDPREASFSIGPGITVAGAYAGCGAANPDARSPFLYFTLLSGDFDQNDDLGLFDENAYHVVTATGATTLSTLSGLVIEGGAVPGGHGGGILGDAGRIGLVACTLRGNRASRGGAVYSENGILRLIGCRFIENHATAEGGAIYDFGSEFEARNCLFTLNSASSDGGAIFFDLCESTIVGCSFGANISQSRGGGIYHYVGVGNTVGNSVFWGNTDFASSDEDAQLFVNPSNLLNIQYSCVEGWSGAFGGAGNIGDDPLLVDVAAGDMHLGEDSPCIDAGLNALVGSQLDLDGNLRIANGIVDMGCYESPAPTDLPQDTDANVARILSASTSGVSGGARILIQTPAGATWRLEAYTVTGRHVAEVAQGVGRDERREIRWAADEASGIYLLRLAVSGMQKDEARILILR